ncbi:MAG: hypothetical protein NVSMB27_32360 [Ktedonobacteraceae bacterium]
MSDALGKAVRLVRRATTFALWLVTSRFKGCDVAHLSQFRYGVRDNLH